MGVVQDIATCLLLAVFDHSVRLFVPLAPHQNVVLLLFLLPYLRPLLFCLASALEKILIFSAASSVLASVLKKQQQTIGEK